METTITLRNLQATDVFVMSKILNNIGIKEFAAVFNRDKIMSLVSNAESTGDKMLQEVGLDVVIAIAGIVFENLDKCEQDIYKLISGLSGLEIKQIKKMPMNDFFEVIIEIIKKPEFPDFMKVVSQLFK